MQACVRGTFLCLLPCVDRSGGPEEEKSEGSHLFYNYCHLLEKGKCIIDDSVLIKFSHCPQVNYFCLG